MLKMGIMLKGKNLDLRALEPGDVDLLYDWENDGKLWHLSNTVAPFSKFTLEQYVLSAGQDIYSAHQLRLMIDAIDEQQPKTIGSIDLFDFDPTNRRAGLGIFIVKEERKKGFASEALEILMDYCFEVLHLHQLYCNITADNEPSLKLFAKHGFKPVGLKKEWLHIRDKWVDEYLYQKVRDH
jgi:diamine N-acetyltransferase